ncbi:enoyl-CoA hydratase [Goodfellowiella coeruleoviolacea]|uniref:Enoyl-CoA hydratase n=1 Tax=Goodfellowiella coeruleoviolacea TaxID=334858 RepID=A0AAE3KF16_9PSEU|nr:enoyl-CoA hydratase [Goodfellowiella coeruleoviolacea]MCP2165906.1 enoyl-CoA hydratase [Goodfellowiella coeruleoviolacea]
MATAEIRVDRRDHVAVLTVHDPDRRNALTLSLSADLASAVAECEQDEDVHAVVVTGTPPAFCAGADLTALGEAREAGLRQIYAGFLALAHCTLPTIAAVGGSAVGAGLNLALACDVRLANQHARFDSRFLQLGIHPGGGMTWMLPRATGQQTTAAMALFGQVVDAATAHRVGLVWQLVDGEHDALVDAAVELAGPAARAPRELVLATKRTMRTTAVLDEHAAAVEAELAAQLVSMESPAFTERLAAMKERISRR